MSAHKAAVAALGAPTVPSVARLFAHHAQDSQAVQRYPIKFTGTGTAYFRIWLVNALLTAITLGGYHPWAKARRLRYFYSHTHIAQHALAFEGQPSRMLRGHLLMVTMVGAYMLYASQASSATGLIAALILAGLVPALLHGSLQFNLAHTSWRGVRFHFTGRLIDAYKLVLTPMGIVLGVSALSAILAIMFSHGSARTAGTIVVIPVALCLYAMVPYTWWRLKHYQHNHYALGALQTRFRAQPLDVVKVFVKTALVAVVSLAMAAGLFGLLLGLAVSSLPAGNATPLDFAYRSMRPLLMLFITVSQLIPFAFFTSRMHNLVWTNTGNQWLRFKSHLAFKPLLGLTLKNAVLTVITCGLYWPFAQIAWTGARLRAVTVHSRIQPDEWLTEMTALAPPHATSGPVGLDLQ